MSTYAKNTGVSAARSREEIERALTRYGAGSFIYGWDGPSAIIGFGYKGASVRFTLSMPDRRAREFTHTPARDTPRTAAKAEAAWEQATRQRWRALLLVVKAKLEAVDAGITTFEQEFMAHLVLPSGETVGDSLLPQIRKGIAGGAFPRLALPLGD